MLTAGETAALLKLEEPVVLEAAESGEIPGRCVSGHWRFAREAVLAWLAGEASVGQD